MNKVLYIAGPYTHSDPIHGVERNILIASEAALAAWKAGWVVICPHKNSAGFHHIRDIPSERWYEGTMELLKRSDAIMVLPNWWKSRGAMKEQAYGIDHGMPILIYNSSVIVPSPKSIFGDDEV